MTIFPNQFQSGTIFHRQAIIVQIKNLNKKNKRCKITQATKTIHIPFVSIMSVLEMRKVTNNNKKLITKQIDQKKKATTFKSECWVTYVFYLLNGLSL